LINVVKKVSVNQARGKQSTESGVPQLLKQRGGVVGGGLGGVGGERGESLAKPRKETTDV